VSATGVVRRHALTFDGGSRRYYIRICGNGVTKKFMLAGQRKESEKLARVIERQVADGEIVIGRAHYSGHGSAHSDIHLSTLVAKYLDHLSIHCAESTSKMRESYLRDFQKHIGTSTLASDVTSAVMDAYVVKVKKRNPKSVNAGCMHIRHVRTLLRWGEELGLCVNHLKKYRVPHEHHNVTHTPTLEDVQRLLAVLPESFRNMVVTGLLTGLRPQELRALTWEQIERTEDSCLIRIVGHKTSRHTPKPRTIPLSQSGIAHIPNRCEENPAMPVFSDMRGNRYSARSFRQRLRRYCKKAGVQNMTPYALRHFFGTMQASGCTNQSVIAQLMGHSRTSTTDRYVANNTEAHEAAVDRLANQLRAILPPILAPTPTK